MGKGSKRRPEDAKRIRENWSHINWPSKRKKGSSNDSRSRK